MKMRILLFIFIVLICVTPAVLAGNNVSTDLNTPLQGGPSSVIGEKFSPAEAGALKLAISESLHRFNQNPDTGAWYGTSTGGQVSFVYDGTARFSGQGSSFAVTLTGLGRGTDLAPAEKGIAEADGSMLNITREGYTEWYRNTNAGVEQGITIPSRPAGFGPLRAGFFLDGDGSFDLPDPHNLTFVNAAGSEQLAYTGLTAFDADGQWLPSSLESDGNMLYWNVDDTGAHYPVTIDPIVMHDPTGGFAGEVTGDSFGEQVAISSDGGVVLISVPGAIGGYGAVYLFIRPTEGWDHCDDCSVSGALVTFTGQNNQDHFGHSLAISSDGSMVFIGTPYHQVNGKNQAGAVYLFKRPSGGWSQGSIPANAADVTFWGNAEGDYFGDSLDVSSDGNSLLVGAPGASPGASLCGAANLFVQPAGGWFSDVPTSSAEATFTGPEQLARFGESVAISGDGYSLLIGAPFYNYDNYSGYVYLFKKPGLGWNGGWVNANAADAKFLGLGGRKFGYSVDISNDGYTVVIGAPSLYGRAYLFVRPIGSWNLINPSDSSTRVFADWEGACKDSHADNFGASVSISGDGSQVLVGSPGLCHEMVSKIYHQIGSAFLFIKPAGGWQPSDGNRWLSETVQYFFTEAYSYSLPTYLSQGFGSSVMISSGGTVALMGAPYIYPYTQPTQLSHGIVHLYTPIPTSEPPSRDNIGIFRSGMFLLDYNRDYGWSGAGSSSTTDRIGWLGQNGDKTIIGDWNGDSKEEMGIFRNGMFLLDYNGDFGWSGSGTTETTDRIGWLGQGGDTPLVGDWNGDSKDEIGIFRSGMFLLDYNRDYGWSGGGSSSTTDRIGWLGQAGDTPIVGDWNKDIADEFGIFRNGMFLLDYNRDYGWSGGGSTSTTDRIGWLGQNGDTPLVGDWNNDYCDEFGIFRNGMFLLDYNRDYGWSGGGRSLTTDRLGWLGQSGDTPIVGRWSSLSTDSVQAVETVTKPIPAPVQPTQISPSAVSLPVVARPAVGNSMTVKPVGPAVVPNSRNPLIVG